MGTRVDRWISDDGKEFTDERSMLIYELSLSDNKIIDLFLSQSGYPEKTRGQYKKVLQKYLIFMRDNGVIPINSVPETKAEEPLFPNTPVNIFDNDLEEYVRKPGSIGYLSDD